MIIAKIFDTKGRQVNQYEGTIKDNVFRCKRNQTKIGFFTFGGEDFTLPCDYEKLMQVGKDKLAYYRYNGKSWIQLKFDDMSGEVNVQDFITYTEMDRLKRDKLLTKPFDANDLIKWIPYVLVILTCLGAIYATKVNYDAAQVNMGGISSIANSCESVAHSNLAFYNSTNKTNAELYKWLAEHN